MDQDTLLNLLSASADGDKQAFADLYQSTSGQLFAVSLKMLGRRELVEEVLQEAYVKIWHHATEYFEEHINDDGPQVHKNKLDQCMGELEPQQKQAIHLAYYNGLSHHEVVGHLDLPLGTIKSWIRRGLQQLQRCLSL